MHRGAIFDMDGLMFDTEAVWQKNWGQIAEEMGIDLDPAFRYSICGTSGALMNHVIEQYFHVSDGSGIAADCKQRVHKDLQIHVDKKKGIDEILSFFHENGVKVAVASSSSEEQIRSNLRMTGTKQYIDAIVSGTSLENGKPAPDIFLKAAEMIGIDPQDCYVFEDAFNGVRAGHAAGCTTIMVPDMSQPDEEIRSLAAAVYKDLSEAKKAIAEGII